MMAGEPPVRRLSRRPLSPPPASISRAGPVGRRSGQGGIVQALSGGRIAGWAIALLAYVLMLGGHGPVLGVSPFPL